MHHPAVATEEVSHRSSSSCEVMDGSGSSSTQSIERPTHSRSSFRRESPLSCPPKVDTEETSRRSKRSRGVVSGSGSSSRGSIERSNTGGVVSLLQRVSPPAASADPIREVNEEVGSSEPASPTVVLPSQKSPNPSSSDGSSNPNRLPPSPQRSVNRPPMPDVDSSQLPTAPRLAESPLYREWREELVATLASDSLKFMRDMFIYKLSRRRLKCSNLKCILGIGLDVFQPSAPCGSREKTRAYLEHYAAELEACEQLERSADLKSVRARKRTELETYDLENASELIRVQSLRESARSSFDSTVSTNIENSIRLTLLREEEAELLRQLQMVRNDITQGEKDSECYAHQILMAKEDIARYDREVNEISARRSRSMAEVEEEVLAERKTLLRSAADAARKATRRMLDKVEEEEGILDT